MQAVRVSLVIGSQLTRATVEPTHVQRPYTRQVIRREQSACDSRDIRLRSDSRGREAPQHTCEKAPQHLRVKCTVYTVVKPLW